MKTRFETVVECVHALATIQGDRKFLKEMGIAEESIATVGKSIFDILYIESTEMLKDARRAIAQQKLDFKSETENNQDRTVEKPKSEVESPKPKMEVVKTSAAPAPEPEKKVENKVPEEPEPAVEDNPEVVNAETNIQAEEKVEEEVSAEGRFPDLGTAVESLYPIALEMYEKGVKFNNPKMREMLHNTIIATFPVGTEHIYARNHADEEVRRLGEKKRNFTIAGVETEVTRMANERRIAAIRERENKGKKPVVTPEVKETVATAPEKKPEPSKSVIDEAAAAAAVADTARKDTVAPASTPENTTVVTPQQIASAAAENATGKDSVKTVSGEVQLTDEDKKALTFEWEDFKKYLVGRLIEKQVKSLTESDGQWALAYLHLRKDQTWITNQVVDRKTGKTVLQSALWLEKLITRKAS